ncbi:integral membrane channel protein [Sodiomyces alkalinus F11]|uniref:Integral membrane channel protein n=1 Tax=Sodiomyces alkalinus (strain CBS 110278 / VKM F-3762 / F11) TaxID=1314773 RepID=A0A3N2Q1F8_SODAK|nr:integral membrane channel protein [Sodiomyces alkalinus F11]ROT40528.1 integral membrane channel protein [Sodiomyces alkalinus F11]
MFSSFLRPKHRGRRLADPDRLPPSSPTSGPAFQARPPHRHATADFTEADDDDEDSNEPRMGPLQDEEPDPNDEDGVRRSMPVLPLFSAAYLDSLPIYNITHAIRIIVQTRTETTLTWEQLRSPQVSQFLVKPMQQQIRTQHFSRATLYALMANCLQFQKEGQMFPGNAGTSVTRAKVCELLALKLLKEYTTRELIDALSYDFYPLQGLPGASLPPANANTDSRIKAGLTASRTSTLEVAIRASAKHFVAHPLVVQQLEAIWSGAISFYSSADTLHRGPPSTPVHPGIKPDSRTPLLGTQSQDRDTALRGAGRRTVILYDPRQASLFKLSRLRVPRYRFFLSTLSLLVLIGLFLAVLAQRSTRITSLELIFWFWSAGFMLDELVGFNEQGFSLYIMSFWNIFDLGILVLLIVYYGMRAYGVFLVDPKHWNDLAYDVLAANAILLLPRIFSVLDHYQYFSQLLIAFRLMAVDLAAVLILVLVACSGFFVFFTLARNRNDASEVAYKIFQILMGFTPAAWSVWPTYSFLEKALMALFLIICHFVVVTILITVLTNSFMKIASNATEEHQFLFALNTISMVKNDALFSYVAPGNIFAWLLMPLRYFLPLKHFVLLNRSIIKVTHFPLLFCIYLYERYWLASSMFEPTDLVENPGRGHSRGLSFVDPSSRTALFSPNVRVREESIVGFQKDHALEEVFRRGPGLTTLRNQRRYERRKTQNAIRSWMDQHDEAGGSPRPRDWPTLESRAPKSHWQRRFSMNRAFGPSRSRQFSDIRSAASDPADLMSQSNAPLGSLNRSYVFRPKRDDELRDHTDADGDDELVTNDEEEEEDAATNTGEDGHKGKSVQAQEVDYFTTPMTSRFSPAAASASPQDASSKAPGAVSPRSGNPRRLGLHSRTLSTNTILYVPQENRRDISTSSASPVEQATPARSQPLSARASIVETPSGSRHRSPRRRLYMATSKPRPIVAPREMAQTAPNRILAPPLEPRQRPPGGARRLSSVDVSTMSDNTNLLAAAAAANDPTAGLPSSFQTQMAMALMKDSRFGAPTIDAADRDRMGRLVLARMKTLEESFADVARELRELKSNTASTAPPTRRNSSGEDLKGAAAAATATIEVAGDDRRRKGEESRPRLSRRSTAKRPGSRKSMKEPLGLVMTKAKGKGKEVARSSDSDDERGENEFKKGSSF